MNIAIRLAQAVHKAGDEQMAEFVTKTLEDIPKAKELATALVVVVAVKGAGKIVGKGYNQSWYLWVHHLCDSRIR